MRAYWTGLVMFAFAFGCEGKAEEPASKPAATSKKPEKNTGDAAQAKQTETPEKSAAAKSGPAKAGPAARVGDGTLVRLSSPGKPPHKPLRYSYAKKSSERMKVTMSSALRMAINGFANPPQVMPAIEMIFSVDLLDVDSGGTASRKTTVGSIAIAETEQRGSPYAKLAARQLQGLEGLVGRDRVTTRGVVLDPELEQETFQQENFQGMYSSMQRSIAQMAAPLPKEPVGIGAKWDAISRVNQFGVLLMQTATYELLELKGKEGKLAVKIIQDRPYGEIRLPGMPPTRHSKLANMSTKGSGHVNFHLDRTVPAGQVESVVVAEQVGELRGKPSKMQLEMRYRAIFEPATK